MPIKADDVQTLHRYAEAVMERVAHHAGNVGAVALALLGAIVWRAEEGSIAIRPYGAKLGNVLHATINNRNFSFRYEHETQEIEMRENGIAGPIIQTFTNSTALPSIETFFRSL
jgi:hypothetical protein